MSARSYGPQKTYLSRGISPSQIISQRNICLELSSGDIKNYLNAIIPIFEMTYNEMRAVFPERRR